MPIILVILHAPCLTHAQVSSTDEQWTDEEIYAANTAADCPYLTQDGKDMILYNNLARLYPKKFAVIELRNWRKSAYLSSLIRTLNNMEPVQALTVNARSTDLAQCWATVSGRKGLYGHNRVDCPSFQNGLMSGENCFYGRASGRFALIDLLVDEGIPDVGHRVNCLHPRFNSVGIGTAEHHSDCHLCYVMDFTSDEGEDYRPKDHSARAPQPEVETEPEPEPEIAHEPEPESIREPEYEPIHDSEPQQTKSEDIKTDQSPNITYTYVRPSEQPKPTDAQPIIPSTSITPSRKPGKVKGDNLLDRYFGQSGKYSVSFVSVGYTHSFADHRHMLSLSLFDFRFGLFGISPLCAEMSVNPWDTRAAYKPSLKLFVPVNKQLAITPYAGAAADISRRVKYINPAYNYDAQRDFYLSAIAGVSLYITAAKRVPLELKLEYRHPIPTASSVVFHPRGLYIGAQIYLAHPWGDNSAK